MQTTTKAMKKLFKEKVKDTGGSTSYLQVKNMFMEKKGLGTFTKYKQIKIKLLLFAIPQHLNKNPNLLPIHSSLEYFSITSHTWQI